MLLIFKKIFLFWKRVTNVLRICFSTSHFLIGVLLLVAWKTALCNVSLFVLSSKWFFQTQENWYSNTVCTTVILWLCIVHSMILTPFLWATRIAKIKDLLFLVGLEIFLVMETPNVQANAFTIVTDNDLKKTESAHDPYLFSLLLPRMLTLSLLSWLLALSV